MPLKVCTKRAEQNRAKPKTAGNQALKGGVRLCFGLGAETKPSFGTANSHKILMVVTYPSPVKIRLNEFTVEI